MATSKLQKFLILFDNPSLLYLPGQFLTGRVLLELVSETPFTGLYFHVIGEGVVRLKSRGQERLHDKEYYIDFRMRLLGEPGGTAVLLSPGIHSFPFKLGLPLGLPSTFLGKSGYVQFYCKAALKEPNGLLHKNQQVFILVNPIDLNQEPAAVAQTFHCEVEHKLGRNSCMSGGLVNIRIRLDKGGYVPGERIHIWAAIDNQSQTPLRSSQATLMETIQYSAKGKVVQTERRPLSTLSRGKVRQQSKDEWVNEKLLVPALPPTNLRGSNLIRIQYDLMFVITPKLPEKKIKVQIPILIATYPLKGSMEGHNTGKLGYTLTPGTKDKFPSILPTYRPTVPTKPIDNNLHH